MARRARQRCVELASGTNLGGVELAGNADLGGVELADNTELGGAQKVTPHRAG